MEVLLKILKDPEKRGRDITKKEDDNGEERKKLKVSIKELEKTNLFNEFKVKDVQKDVQTRELIIREKDKIIDGLLPLQQKNEQLIGRIKDLEEKLFLQVRLKQSLEERIQKQADELGKAHQKRIEEARTASMNIINEHIQLLQNLFQKSNMNEECLAAFVTSADAIRTAVGINLI